MIIIRRQFPEKKKRRINKYSSEMTQKSTTHKINCFRFRFAPCDDKKKTSIPKIEKNIVIYLLWFAAPPFVISLIV